MLPLTSHKFAVRFLQPIARRLEEIEIRNAKTAHFFCRLIPAQCPFERDIRCFGRVLTFPTV